jgi:hypothetical protein
MENLTTKQIVHAILELNKLIKSDISEENRQIQINNRNVLTNLLNKWR